MEWHETLVEVHRFLASEAGVSCVQRNLQRRRLPGALDTDVEGLVADEARRFLARGGEIVNVAAWCRLRISSRTIDLARGMLRAEKALTAPVAGPAQHDDPDGWEYDGDEGDVETGVEVGGGAFDGVGEGELSGVRLDSVRAQLLSVEPGWVAASALAVVVRVAEGGCLHPDCPQPVAGATPTDAAMWAGLWYARQQQCFAPAGSPNTNTITRRRARAAARVRDALRAVLQSGSGPAGGGR